MVLCVQGARADAKRLLKREPTNDTARALLSHERVRTAPRSFEWFI